MSRALDAYMIAHIRRPVNLTAEEPAVGKPDLFHIHQTWTDLREARVKDGFIFRVSRYFIDHWLRLLGPKAAWAVVDLQQRCYLAKADFCQVSLKDLCRVTGVRSTTTMQAIVDKPLMRWFFAKRNTRQCRAGKVVRGRNRYELHMSDPLTPQHQGQIARLLATRLHDGTVSAINGPDDLIRLVSDIPPLSTLPADDLPTWATREPLNMRRIALRVLSDAGITDAQASLADEPALRKAFADAQARITQPTRIALTTHYFRNEWVPELGPTNAWLIMALRSRCYWNKESGQVRDLCVMSNQELADLLGTSTRTIIRGLKHPNVGKFVTAQERVYEPRAGDGRKIPTRTRFHVLLTMEPLTPPDEAAFAQIILSDAARYGLDPTTGQMNMLDILDMMSQMTADEMTLGSHSSDKPEIRGQHNTELTDKNGIRGSATQTITVASSDKNEIRSSSLEPETTLETESSDRSEIRRLRFEPSFPVSSALEGGSAGESSDRNEIRTTSGDKTGFREAHSGDKIETITPESSDRIGKQYLNTSLNTHTGGEGQQQQYTSAAAGSAHSLHKTLTDYGVEEPALSRILANPQVTSELAHAWILYAQSEPSLDRKIGYVVQRLTRTPPDVPTNPDLMLLAGLSDEALSGFAQRRALEWRMGANVSFDDAHREAQYEAWLRFYGHERDVSRGDETTLESDGRRASRWQPDVG